MRSIRSDQITYSDSDIVTPWSTTLRIGNPVRSELVAQYLTFATGEQKQAGVRVKQAPAILHDHLETIMRSMGRNFRVLCSS